MDVVKGFTIGDIVTVQCVMFTTNHGFPCDFTVMISWDHFSVRAMEMLAMHEMTLLIRTCGMVETNRPSTDFGVLMQLFQVALSSSCRSGHNRSKR